MNETKFLICEICGNIIQMIHDAGVPVYCCGQEMTEMKPNTSDGAAEKHVPVVRQQDGALLVDLGSAAHPMNDDHLIEWVYVETEHGGQRLDLHPGDDTHLKFTLCCCDKPRAVYAYCNLHGLWAAKLS